MFPPEILLVAYLLLALGVSFLCSLMESSLLTLPMARVIALRNAGKASGRWLTAMKENIERPLAAILTLNTVAHTVGAAGVGAEAYVVFGEAWVAVTSAVLTILILVLSEIIPKTLGVVYAGPLAPYTAYTVQAMIVITYPLVVVFQWISAGLGGRRTVRFTREDFALMAELGHAEGALLDKEYRIIRNLLRLRAVRVEEVMTPRTVVFMLPQDQAVREVVDTHGAIRFARIPVYGTGPDNVTGIVLRHDIHDALRAGRGDERLRALAQPIHAVPETASLEVVLDEFMQRRGQLFLVVDEHGGTAGIITLEDALETLLGAEIVDETDVVPDMRKLADRLFEAKLRSLRFWAPRGRR